MATADELRSVLCSLGTVGPASDDVGRIDQLRVLEELKSAICAAQASIAVEFAASQRALQLARGVRSDRADRGIAGQLGLALRRSPHAASRFLGFARIATTELPETFAALQQGRTTEWRAMLIARETAVLSREHRALVDAELAAQLGELGDRGTEVAARRAAYRLDPHAALLRARKAQADRRVTLRPAPDTMAYLTALLPCAEAVAAYAALGRAADSTTAVGDERGRGQIMADTLVERVTGQATAEAVPVEVNMIVDEDVLLGESNEPAHLDGYGPIPAGLARDLLTTTRATDRARHAGTSSQATADHGGTAGESAGDARTTGESAGHSSPAGESAGDASADDARTVGEFADETTVARRTLRRLFRSKAGRLIAMETTARDFTPHQKLFIRLRDQTCRTPYCDAPVRHIDHAHDHACGGITGVCNAQGLCENCNHTKQAHGWTARVTTDGSIDITTPTGHHYRSRAPDQPDRPERPRHARTRTTWPVDIVWSEHRRRQPRQAA